MNTQSSTKPGAAQRGPILVWAILLALMSSSSAYAQIGTPGNGPLTPGGPRQGLGPPSITDNVPDLRLRSSGGGIPGAGAPVTGGGYGRPQPMGRSGLAAPGAYDNRPAGVRVRVCRTSRRTCTIETSARPGARCSCRLPSGGRARGSLIR